MLIICAGNLLMLFTNILLSTTGLADARVSQTRTRITPDNFNDLHCSEVMISEDEIVEEDEYLLLKINSLDSIDLENSTKIIISDDDGNL